MRNKEKRDRFLALLMSFCLTFTAMIPATVTTAYAATTYKVKCIDSGLNYGAGSQSIFERGDGTAVYCGEHDVYSPVDEGDTANLSFTIYTKSNMLTKALFYGKGGPKEWSGFKNYTTKEAKCITALAISNAYIDTGDAKSAAEKVDLDDVKGLKSFWNYIKEKTTPDTERFEVYRYAGDAWTQSLFTFEYYPKGEGTLVKKSSSSYTTNGNGYYLKDAKYGVYESKSDAEENKNKVGTLTTIAGGTSNELTLDVGTYYVKETKAPEGYELDETIHTMKIKEDETTTLNVKDTPLKGKLQIIKKADHPDTEKNPNYSLKGAEFKVYRDKEKENYVTTLTTDDQGQTKAFSCIADKYYIYETKAPKGFHRYEEVITASVTIGQTLKKTVTEESVRGQIQIRKISANQYTEDNANYSLKGAKFSVYRDKAKTEKVATLTTDEQGMTQKFTCIADTYYVYEDQAPYGFERIEGLVGSFDTAEAFLDLGQDYVYTVKENPVRGQIQIVKDSSDDTVKDNPNYSLAGAKFSIYRDKGKKEKVTTLVTGKDGKTPEFTCIADTYYVYEDEAPKGYKRIEGLIGFFDTGESFLKLNQKYVYHVQNQPVKGSIQVIKKAEHPELIDGNENYSLEGAVFGVYQDKECQNLLKELTTDESGKTQEFSVYASNYYVKELKAPKGFRLNPEIFSAPVTVGNKKIITVDEKEETGKFMLKKITSGRKINAELVKLAPMHYTLEGAEYGIFTSEEDAKTGKNPVGTLTTDVEGDTEAIVLPLGTYWIKELKPSKGYLLDEELYSIQVVAGKQMTLTVKEQPVFDTLAVLLRKADKSNADILLSDAEFEVRYYPELTDDVTKLTPVRTWMFRTDERGEIKLSKEGYVGGDPLFEDAEGNVVGLIGTYVLIETKAPKGYLLNEQQIIGQMTVNDTQTGLMYQTPTAENEPQKVIITVQKTDSETGKTVPQTHGSFAGAVYDIYTIDDATEQISVVDTLITDDNGKASSDLLPPGRYYVKEKTAPPGYIVNPEAVEIEAYSTDAETSVFYYNVNMKESPTTTEVHKIDATTRAYVAGAVLAVFDESGTEIERWTTEKAPHVIKALRKGTYRLKELSAPSGYLCADDLYFQVEEAENVQKVVMVDDHTKILIRKLDLYTDAPVANTSFALIPADEDGNPQGEDAYMTVPSDEEGRISLNYIPAGSYILNEVNANIEEGYVTAEDRLIEVKAVPELQEYVVKDDHTKVEFMKSDAETGEPVIGTQLSIIPIDKDGKPQWDEVYSSWTTDELSHLEKYMPTGKYLLTEQLGTQAFEDGYVTADSIVFTVEDTGELQTVEMKDDYTKVRVSKIDAVTGEPVSGALLKVIDYKGDVVHAWETTEQGELIERLPIGEYTLIEEKAPDGYEKAKDIKFTIADSGEIQEVVMEDKPVVPTDEHIPDTGDRKQLLPLVLFAVASFCSIIVVRKIKGVRTENIEE